MARFSAADHDGTGSLRRPELCVLLSELFGEDIQWTLLSRCILE